MDLQFDIEYVFDWTAFATFDQIDEKLMSKGADYLGTARRCFSRVDSDTRIVRVPYWLSGHEYELANPGASRSWLQANAVARREAILLRAEGFWVTWYAASIL